MAKKGQTKAGAKKRSVQQRKYNSTAKAKKERAMRNKARRQAEKEGKVTKGDGKDIDHKKPLRDGGSNKKSNQRVRSKTANRADNGSRKGVGGKKKRGKK
jgi:hypothetical protein